jgi:hypothetical protein
LRRVYEQPDVRKKAEQALRALRAAERRAQNQADLNNALLEAARVIEIPVEPLSTLGGSLAKEFSDAVVKNVKGRMSNVVLSFYARDPFYISTEIMYFFVTNDKSIKAFEIDGFIKKYESYFSRTALESYAQYFSLETGNPTMIAVEGDLTLEDLVLTRHNLPLTSFFMSPLVFYDGGMRGPISSLRHDKGHLLSQKENDENFMKTLGLKYMSPTEINNVRDVLNRQVWATMHASRDQTTAEILNLTVDQLREATVVILFHLLHEFAWVYGSSSYIDDLRRYYQPYGQGLVEPLVYLEPRNRAPIALDLINESSRWPAPNLGKTKEERLEKLRIVGTWLLERAERDHADLLEFVKSF